MAENPTDPTIQRPLPAPDAQAWPDAAAWPEGLVTTGDAAVNRTLAVLAELPERPLSEHPALYEELRNELAEALDASPASQAGMIAGAP
ncbi:hypothetical protein [Psychromicrobium xiongbiense]|uniref:hypothetical protein n=1 Tax=Psychromicrobium xiongbiense TaxID=3051184 RepID=UPI002552FFD0|nr:hypothetical protein [Psychromicrobium sp. YIM S02556]